jgi:uncharacterized membrane protein
MNIHPIFVHFPIALLSVYALLELVRSKRIMQSREWLYIKSAFLFLGSLGTGLALFTGDFGKHLYPAQRAIINVHENFADATTIIFGIVTLIYLVAVIDALWGDLLRTSKYASSWNSIVAFDRRFFSGFVVVPLAVIGFCLLCITGALGGSIVYGANADFFTHIVNKLFVR